MLVSPLGPRRRVVVSTDQKSVLSSDTNAQNATCWQFVRLVLPKGPIWLIRQRLWLPLDLSGVQALDMVSDRLAGPLLCSHVGGMQDKMTGARERQNEVPKWAKGERRETARSDS
jgi:hypothetical protein